MKHILLLLISIVLVGTGQVQSQEANTFTYQAVARDAKGNIIPERNISVQTAIQNGRGTEVYTERHNTTTSDIGLFTLEIGAGTPVTGIFNQIDWSATRYNLRIDVDLDGGTNFQPIGESPILAVPIATFAKMAQLARESQSINASNVGLDTLNVNKLFGGTICIDTLVVNNPNDPGDSEWIITWDQETNSSVLGVDELHTYYAWADTIDSYVGRIDTIFSEKVYALDYCTTNGFGDIISLTPRNSRFHYPNLSTDLRLLVQDNEDNPGTPDVRITENDLEFLRKTIGFDESFQAPYKRIAMRETFTTRNSRFAEGRISPLFYQYLKYYPRLDNQNPEVPYLNSGSFYDEQTQQLAAFIAFGLNPFLTAFTMNQSSTLWQNISNGMVLYERQSHGMRRTEEGFNYLSGLRAMYIDWLLGCVEASKYDVLTPNSPDGVNQYAFRVVAGTDASRFERGTGQLVNGEATIELSLPFCQTVNMETMTVQITPLSADTYGVAVVEKMPTGFKVKELAGGNGNFGFDWEVKCIVSGEENFTPVRPLVSRDASSSEQTDIQRLGDRVQELVNRPD